MKGGEVMFDDERVKLRVGEVIFSDGRVKLKG